MPTHPLTDTKVGIAAARIAGLYAAFGILWIWVSDPSLAWLGYADRSVLVASVVKGTAFVLVTAALLFWLVRREMTQARRSENLLRAVVEGTTDAVFVKDREGRYLLANAAAAGFMGRTVDQVLGRDDRELFDPADAERLMAGDRNIMDGGGVVTAEESLLSAGTRRTYLATKAPYRDAAGAVIGLVGISRDISERKRAEVALWESEARFRELADAIPQIVWTAGPDGGLTHVNARGLAYSGRCAGELLGRAWDEAVHPADLPTLVAARADASASGMPRDFEFRLRRADGVYRWHVCQQVPAQAADGTTAGWYGTLTDIDDLKKTETALRESEWRFRSVFEHAAIGIGITDADGRFLQCNPAYCRVLGLSEDELRVADLAPLIHPDDREENMALLCRLAAGEISGYELENRFLRPSREAVWVHKYVTAFGSGTGRAAYLMALVTDVTERRRADEALRASEERLRLAQQAGGIGIYDWDVTTGVSVWTEIQEAIYGLPAGTFGGRHDDWARRVHPDDRGRVAAELERGFRERRAEDESEYRIVRADGEVRWVVNRGRTTYDPAGRPVRMVGTTIDVTERRRAEQEVRASEERYRRLVEVLPEAVFINADDRVTYCNPACIALFGAADTAALAGRSPLDLFAPEFHDAIRDRIRVMRETGAAVPGHDERIVRLDGRTALAHVVATPITDGGRPAILVCLRDLSERERTLGLLRNVLGSVSDAILTIDARGTVESANPATERLFGYAEAELLGQNVRVLMPEPDRGRHDGYIANYLQTGEAQVIGVGREVDGRRKDGSTFPVELTVTEFRLDGERRFTGVLRDITARRRLEDQFRQAQKMEAVGRLAGGVAHDFNNLLTVINGHCELLLATHLPAGDRSREAVAAVRDAGQRAARLTQQLLAFSRKTILEPKVIDLNELLTESAKLLRRLIGEDIILAVVTAPTPVRVKADPGQLEQVIMNLAVNARDAMPTGGRLTIETSTAADGDSTRFACLAVADTGQGMTDEVRGKIFEPFFTTKGVGKGTGLGLAVVHGVVAQSGGRISVDSRVGVGTTFRLLLPLVAGEAAGPAAEAAPVATRGIETVLLVEDEDAVRMIARLALEMQGYTVLEADGGAAAVRLAEEHPGEIHLLVSDVVMPEMGGRQLLEEVRRHRPGVRVLFMSGYTDDAVLLHGVVEATDAFIQKPFTPLGLARKVREVIDTPAR